MQSPLKNAAIIAALWWVFPVLFMIGIIEILPEMLGSKFNRLYADEADRMFQEMWK